MHLDALTLSRMKSLSKNVCEREEDQLKCVKYAVQNGQESPHMAGQMVYIDIPSKTSRYTLFCEIVDHPRFKNRTARPYKPVSQSAMIVCQN